MSLNCRTAAACLIAALLTTVPVHARETLAAARELYAAAAYTDALTMLNGLLAVEPAAEDRLTIALYRTLCLVALGRKAEADRAIESMIAQDPLYRPSSDDVPPRMRSAFSEARKRLLPSLIQQKYSEAKAAFDRKNFDAAAAGFKQVRASLDDPDIAAVAAQPPLSDLRMLADGFHDLSAKAAVPAPSAPAAAVAAASGVVAPRIYTAEDRTVVPPLTVKQQIPPFRGKVAAAANGVVEVVIGVTGTVESARMSVPLNGQYDALVVAAAKSWKYQPAKVNGVPVKFRKFVKVSLLPTPPPR